ncbi:hypothetical protein ANCCAN_28460 [Ancylostoma caninum]|uniref:Uncharacterized protein n=1 Tax=Ancylostoma caninum TaxID=29170 RepID=A0A368F156_ANCCA|nr:hypothetical protein ANCCAN_28460 [Ancylostoma caninum]
MILLLLTTLTYEYINIYYWFFAVELIVGLTGGMGYFFGIAMTIVTDDSRNKLKPVSDVFPCQ